MVTVDIISKLEKRESLKHKNKMTQIWSVSLISFVGCRKSNKTKKKEEKICSSPFFAQVIVVLVTAFNDWSKEKQFRGLQVSCHTTFTFTQTLSLSLSDQLAGSTWLFWVLNVNFPGQPSHLISKWRKLSSTNELFVNALSMIRIIGKDEFIIHCAMENSRYEREMQRRLKIDF